MKLLGRLGWHGQCACCCGKDTNRQVKRREKVAWQRDDEQDWPLVECRSIVGGFGIPVKPVKPRRR